MRPLPSAVSRLLVPFALGGTVLAFWWLRIVVPAREPDLVTTDLRLFFYPTYLTLFGRLAHGGLPLWNPYQLCGLPAVGAPEGGLFYPPHLLFLVLPPNVALAVLAIAHLLVVAYATAWFARRIGVGAAAAMLAAVLFALHGTIRAWLFTPPLLEAVAWLPVGAIAIVELVRRPSARGTAFLAGATALSWLAGGPEATLSVLYAWSTLWLALMLGDRPPASRWLVAAGLYAAAIALGTLAAGVQLGPTIEMVRFGTRAAHFALGNADHLMLLTDFTLAVAAAIAVGALWTREQSGDGPPGRFGVARIAVIAAATALIAGRIRWGAPLPVVVPAAVLVLVVGPWRRSTAGAVVLLAVATAEAFLAPPNTGLLPYRGAGAAEYHAANDVYDALRAQQGSDRVWIIREPFTSAAFAPKLAGMHGVRSLDDSETITLRRQAEYFTYLLEGRVRPLAGMPTNVATAGLDRLAAQRRLLDLTATRLVLLPAHMLDRPDVRQLTSSLGWRPLPSPRPDLLLFENQTAVPRAYVTYRTTTAPPVEELLALTSAAAFDPLTTSFVEAPPLPQTGPVPRGRPATIVRDDEEVVEIDATLDAPGLVVLADSLYPGWRATVDDVPAEILATNHLFRGVRAPAGTHRVRFVYKPASVLIGRGATFAGLIVLVALVVIPAFGRGRRP